MKYKYFIEECKKGFMSRYDFKNGVLICSQRFFEDHNTYEVKTYSKFFDKKRRLKKFLKEVKR